MFGRTNTVFDRQKGADFDVRPKFTFNGHQLRTIELDGKPWFHAADACRIIGLDVRKGTHTHTKRLDPSDRRMLRQVDTPSTSRGVWRKQETQATFITKGGLYALIMRAQTKRPEVVEFQRWVTHEVLPAIEKTGGYLLNEEAREDAHADTREAMPLPPEVMQALQALQRQVLLGARA